jgi:hypothetical protein
MNVVVMQVVDNGNGTKTVTLQNRSVAPGATSLEYPRVPVVFRAEHKLANAPVGSEHVINGRWLEGGEFVYEGRAD